MLWSLTTATAYHEAAKAGFDTSAFEPPELMMGFDGWVSDFFELSSDRQIGMGVGPIPASSIDRHTASWDYDSADMFRACIRAMDGAYMAHVNKSGSGTDNGDQGSKPMTAQEAFKAAFGGGRINRANGKGRNV